MAMESTGIPKLQGWGKASTEANEGNEGDWGRRKARGEWGQPKLIKAVRACLETPWGPAARDFGGGQGGEAGASPQWAVTAEPTRAVGKRSAARRVFAEKAAWLRCSSVTDRCGYAPSSRLALRPFPRKQDPTEFSNRLYGQLNGKMFAYVRL